MFSINDTVLYGANGVCRITDICQKEFSGVIKDYYILTPLSNETMTIFVPVNNKLLTNRIKRILSKGEICDLICDIKFLLWRIEFQTESKALMQAVNRIEEEKLSVIAVEYIIRTACFDKKNVLLKLCECYIRLNKEDKAFQMLKYGKDINR